jgi:hypothetical protein
MAKDGKMWRRRSEFDLSVTILKVVQAFASPMREGQNRKAVLREGRMLRRVQ